MKTDCNAKIQHEVEKNQQIEIQAFCPTWTFLTKQLQYEVAKILLGFHSLRWQIFR